MTAPKKTDGRRRAVRVKTTGQILARAIFNCGNWGGAKATRIQFMSGEWPTEKALGGFCESALASTIDYYIRKRGLTAKNRHATAGKGRK